MMKSLLLLLLTSGILLASPDAAGEKQTPPPGMMPPPRHHEGFDKEKGPGFPHAPEKMKGKRSFMAARWQEIVLTMSKLSKENPEEYARLKALRSSNPPAFIQEIRKYLPRPKGINVNLAKVETECREIAAKIKAAKSDAEKAELEKQLKTKLHESFNLVIANATERVETIQKQIQQLKEQEEYIVNDRFEMLTQP